MAFQAVIGFSALILPLLLCAGCSTPATTGTTGSQKLPQAVRDPSEVGELVAALPGTSSRCKDGLCACRPIDEYGAGQGATDAEDPPPAEDRKRFELRTGRGNDDYRITVEGVGTFHKSGPDPEPGCIYVDLPAGTTRVRYHVVAQDPHKGLEARLRVSEYSPSFKSWYRTFAFRCGNGSEPCNQDDARDAITELGKVPGGKHDPCGSTKVQGLRFSTERPGDAAVSDFNLQLVLNVYPFIPRFRPGSKKCTGISYKAEPQE